MTMKQQLEVAQEDVEKIADMISYCKYLSESYGADTEGITEELIYLCEEIISDIDEKRDRCKHKWIARGVYEGGTVFDCSICGETKESN